jgi:hypothetical protein
MGGKHKNLWHARLGQEFDDPEALQCLLGLGWQMSTKKNALDRDVQMELNPALLALVEVKYSSLTQVGVPFWFASRQQLVMASVAWYNAPNCSH